MAGERPILFYVSENQVTETLESTISNLLVNRERALPVVYKPQAIFRFASNAILGI